MSEAPITPYAGTSGWSGSDTSRERAETEDSNGTTSMRQARTLREVMDHGVYGMTVKELRDITGWHHGQASSTLSVLHKEGRLARLKERRDRCAVYVTPDDVRDREVSPHRSNNAAAVLTPYEEAVLTSVTLDLDRGMQPIRREVKVLVEALGRVTNRG